MLRKIHKYVVEYEKLRKRIVRKSGRRADRRKTRKWWKAFNMVSLYEIQRALEKLKERDSAPS